MKISDVLSKFQLILQSYYGFDGSSHSLSLYSTGFRQYDEDSIMVYNMKVWSMRSGVFVYCLPTGTNVIVETETSHSHWFDPAAPAPELD